MARNKRDIELQVKRDELGQGARGACFWKWATRPPRWPGLPRRNVAPNTLYWYYRSKEELLVEGLLAHPHSEQQRRDILQWFASNVVAG